MFENFLVDEDPQPGNDDATLMQDGEESTDATLMQDGGHPAEAPTKH